MFNSKFDDWGDWILYIKINIFRLIDNERPTRQSRAFDWTDYKTYAEIYDWLDQQLVAFPTVLSNVELGNTYQGRPIRMVKLSYKAVSTKQIIFNYLKNSIKHPTIEQSSHHY